MTGTETLEDAAQPSCPLCNTVMREVDGGYECAWDGTRIDMPWVERPTSGDDLRGVHG